MSAACVPPCVVWTRSIISPVQRDKDGEVVCSKQILRARAPWLKLPQVRILSGSSFSATLAPIAPLPFLSINPKALPKNTSAEAVFRIRSLDHPLFSDRKTASLPTFHSLLDLHPAFSRSRAMAEHCSSLYGLKILSPA